MRTARSISSVLHVKPRAVPVHGKRWDAAPLGVSTDGKVVAVLQAKRADSDGFYPNHAVALLDVTSGHRRVLERLRDSTVQPAFAQADRRWVVWQDAREEPGEFSDWTLKAYDRRTGRLHVVARRILDRHKHVIATPGVRPILRGHRVYWSAAAPRGRRVALAAFSTPVKGGAVRRLLNDAAEPFRARGRLFVKGHHRGHVTIDSRRLTGGPRSVLLSGHHVAFFTVTPDACLAWTTLRATAVTLADGRGRTVARFTDSHSHGIAGFLVSDKRVIAWDEEESSCAYLVRSGQLVRLGSRVTSNDVHVAGEWLLYSISTDGKGPSEGNYGYDLVRLPRNA